MKTKIPVALVTMSRSGYFWRGALYFAIAFLGVLQLGLETGKPAVYILIAAMGSGLTAVRAFIDKSPAQVESGGPMKQATSAADEADAATATTDATTATDAA